ncbi:MAG: DMT family transporter [Variibacter sp.]
MPFTQWFLLIFLSILWGGMFLFVNIAVQEIPVLTLVFARVFLAAAALAPLLYIKRLRLPSTFKYWQPFIVLSLLNNIIPFVLIARAQEEIAIGLASVLQATTPLFGVLLAHLFTADEKLTPRRLSGVLIGVVGVAVLVGPETLFGSSGNLLGMVLMLGAACSYGGAGVWSRRFQHTPPLVTSTGLLVCSTVVLFPLTVAIDRPWQLAMPSGAAIVSIISLALLSTALAYILFFRIMAVSGPTNTWLVTLLNPISAIALGAMILGEALLPHHIAGALLIACALIILDGRIFATLRLRIW